MVQVINKKTVCRVEVIANNRVIAQTFLNIPSYPELKDWQTIVNNRERYLNKKVREIKADYNLLRIDYDVVVYVMSKLN